VPKSEHHYNNQTALLTAFKLSNYQTINPLQSKERVATEGKINRNYHYQQTNTIMTTNADTSPVRRSSRSRKQSNSYYDDAAKAVLLEEQKRKDRKNEEDDDDNDDDDDDADEV
jgi:hypothetical protein